MPMKLMLASDKRVEVEEDIARPIVGMVTEVFRPVGGIADLGPSAEDRAHIGSKEFERGHRRIGAGTRPNGGQTGHFRPDQEGVNAPAALQRCE